MYPFQQLPLRSYLVAGIIMVLRAIPVKDRNNPVQMEFTF